MASNRVSTDPRLPFGADPRLYELLREHAQAMGDGTGMRDDDGDAVPDIGKFARVRHPRGHASGVDRLESEEHLRVTRERVRTLQP